MDIENIIDRMSDDGRFTQILSSLNIKEICFTKCPRGNPTLIQDPRKMYRCAVPGSCIGVTLRNELIMYMLHKAEVITKRQLQIHMGP